MNIKKVRKEFKKIMLKVWIHLRDNPGIRDKCYLPGRLYAKIKRFDNECPFCELSELPYYEGDKLCHFTDRERCPLDYKGDCYWFSMWCDAVTDKERSRAAGKIVEKVEKWEP